MHIWDRDLNVVLMVNQHAVSVPEPDCNSSHSRLSLCPSWPLFIPPLLIFPVPLNRWLRRILNIYLNCKWVLCTSLLRQVLYPPSLLWTQLNETSVVAAFIIRSNITPRFTNLFRQFCIYIASLLRIVYGYYSFRETLNVRCNFQGVGRRRVEVKREN